MGLFTVHQMSFKKWKTTFIALGILGLLTFGSKFRSQNQETQKVQFRRHLLQESEGSGQTGFNPGDMIEDGTDKEDTTGIPSCDLEQSEFKSKLKFYLKAHDDPASVVITCEAGTAVCIAFCKDGSSRYEEDVTTLSITVDDCRSTNITCECIWWEHGIYSRI